MDARGLSETMKFGGLNIAQTRLREGRKDNLHPLGAFGHGHERLAPHFQGAAMAFVGVGIDDLHGLTPSSFASMRRCQARQYWSARRAMTAMATPARKPMPKLPLERPI